VFGDVTAGTSSTLSLQVTNNEPAGALKLSKKLSGVNAGAFSVTGGTCKNRLEPGQSCTYQVKLKAKKKNLGAVAATLTITGAFKPGVCKGTKESQPVTLAGFVVSTDDRTNGSQ
jgi:Abnormal spindle-like microcephaly-assoc'd, ASPM-SPD-2-Hydin